MMIEPATPQQIENLFVEIDDLTVKRILETRATLEEIAEARADLDEQRFGEWRAPTSPRVEAIRGILEDLILGDEDVPDNVAS